MSATPSHRGPGTKPGPRFVARAAWLAAALAAAAATVALAPRLPAVAAFGPCPDAIQFQAAATLLREGDNPYDPAGQARVQQGLGWDRDRDGLGVYDFLPYYYPPWLALAFSVLLPLGWPAARVAWLLVGIASLVGSGVLLARRAPACGAARADAWALTLGLAFSWKAVVMGQVAPMLLLPAAAAWHLLARRRDAAAGVALALLSTKPQLGAVLLAGVLLWCVRQRRWQAPASFAITMLLLCVASSLAFPGWPAAMAGATQATPLPSALYPGLGTTLATALQAVGVHEAWLALACAAVALPLLALIAVAAWTGSTLTLRSGVTASGVAHPAFDDGDAACPDSGLDFDGHSDSSSHGAAHQAAGLRDERTLATLFGLGLLAPFFVMPYARPYDFAVLAVPALVLLGRLPRRAGTALVTAMLAGSAAHLVALALSATAPVLGQRRPEFLLMWIPLLLGGSWLLEAVQRSRREEP